MKRFSYLKLIAIFSILIISLIGCKNSTSPSTDLKKDAAGTWTVTRTLVTPSTDFPVGYKDIQEWTITINGETAVLKTPAGNINGNWAISKNFNYSHWVFQYVGPDPRTGMEIKVIVEIIGVNPLKGTDETYTYDSINQIYLLADSFSIEGVRK